jgi:glutamate synthase (NADPH/NADH) large chain
VAYVHDPSGRFPDLLNDEMVELEPLTSDDLEVLLDLIGRHAELTGSPVAARLLDGWPDAGTSFYKVMPKDYRRVLTVMDEASRAGLSEAETLARVMAAAHG